MIKSKKDTLILILFIFISAHFLWGCGSSSYDYTYKREPLTERDTPSYLAITPQDVTVSLEARVVFKVVGFRDSLMSPVDAGWSIISGVGTIEPTSGIYYSNQAGSAEVMASYKGLTATTRVSVEAIKDTTPPAAPASLSATSEINSVTLSWESGAEEDLTGYNIYRRATTESSFLKTASVGLVITYTNGSLTENTAYYYKMTAFDTSSNESSFSSQVMVTTKPLPAPDIRFYDDAETDFSKWFGSGFSRSTYRKQSGFYSFYSGQGNNLNNWIITSPPIPASSESLSLSFWYYYDTESGFDRFYLESSIDYINWSVLKTYTGNSNGWKEESVTLPNAPYFIYIRFKYVTDSSVAYEGVYIDDISVR